VRASPQSHSATPKVISASAAAGQQRQLFSFFLFTDSLSKLQERKEGRKNVITDAAAIRNR